jgi:NB-ARC domain/Tetratricopeptide repeat
VSGSPPGGSPADGPGPDHPDAGRSRMSTSDLEWREIRDALWLATKLQPSTPDRSASPPPEAGPSPSPRAQPDPVRPEPPVSPQAPVPEHPPQPQDWAVEQSRQIRTTMFGGDESAATGSLSLPAAPALPNGLRIAKALRPLTRRRPSPWHSVLDEETTAERAAQDRLWLPAFRPAAWREFELLLVVDTAGAFDVFQETIREFGDLFSRQGAFRDVRIVQLDGTTSGDGEIQLRTAGPDGAVHGWRDQIDPTGRTLILVLTDGISDGWRSGKATQVIASWGRHTPVALVNLLPLRLWHWSGLLTRQVKLKAPRPGVPNARLRVRTGPGLFVKDDSAIPVPVLGLEPDWWVNWAKLVATPGAGWVDTTTVFVEPDAVVEEFPSPPEDTEVQPRERVLKFRTVASVQAFQLAMLLAAAPLSLPAIKMVQRVLLPAADLAAVAEVLLGGLLRKTSFRPADETVTYEFHTGVREELLAMGRRGDTVRVARLIGDYLGPRNPIIRNFREALANPENAPEPEPTIESHPHLSVQAAVFRALSGPYGPRAARLRRKLEETLDATPASALLDHGITIKSPTSTESVKRREDDEPVGGVQDPMTEQLPKPGAAGGRMTTPGAAHSPDTGHPVARQPQIWGAVPLRNPDFVGRTSLLDQLQARLIEPGMATAVLPEALHGMGGVGKSQTVVEYIYRHATEYDIVWWIPSEHPTQIRSSFVELAARLGIKASSAETAVPAVLEMLRNGMPDRRWILVFDNAEHLDTVRHFLPTGLGHVVVTSRNSEWSGVARKVEVDLFTREESIELLRRRGGGTITDEDANHLAEALGDLPLAVEQAASWRAQTGMQAAEYVQLLEENSAELLQAGSTGESELPVAAAWNVPLNRLKTDRRSALELLQVCAFFSPEPISRSLFTGVRGAPVPEALADAFGDPIKLNHAIREINRYSLAKIDHSRNTIQLHRLVQAVLRDQLDHSQWENMRHSVHLMLVNGDPGDPDNSVNWPTYAALLPHAINSRAVDCRDTWVRTLVTNLVQYLFASGDYQGSLTLAEQASSARKELLGENDVDTLIMGRHYGNALWRVGRIAESRVVSDEVYEQMREHLGEDHEVTMAMASGQTAKYRVEGRIYDERDAMRELHTRARRVLGEDDLDTLRYANFLASILRMAGEYFEARDLDERIARRRAALLGSTHAATLNSRSGLAMDIRECGLYVEACAMQEETSAEAVEALGRDHPLTIGGDRCLAVARRKAGLHDKAMELTEDCYNRYRLRHGEGHIDTVTGMMDMATELRHMGELDEALKYGLRSVEDFEKIYYTEHPFVLIAATNLAVIRRLRGDLDEARRLNERAINGFMERLGPDHPYTLVAKANLASDLAELGEIEAARDSDMDTLGRSRAKLGDEHPTTLAVSHNLSMDLNLLGNPDEAAILHTKTTASFRKVLGDAHPATLAASQNVRANCDTDTMQL